MGELLAPLCAANAQTRGHHNQVAARVLCFVAGEVTPSAITVQHVTQLVEEVASRAWAPITVWCVYHDLRRLLTSLIPAGAKPGLGTLVPMPRKPAPRPVTLPSGVLVRLLELAEPWLRLAILLCHDCALRAGTAVIVARKHIERGYLVVPTKGGTVTRLPLSGRIVELISMCPAGDAPLVSLLRGRPMGYFALYDHWTQLLAKAGLPPGLRLHDLRRTMAESAYAVTSDLRVVQTLLGHDSLRSTVHYLQRPPVELSRAQMDTIAEGVK